MNRIVPFFMAWGMFCAIPCPYPHWDNDKRPAMLACFPLIGLLIGAIWTLAAWLVGLLHGLGLFGAVLLAFLPYLLTGFIHLDGFMDCCDAILSRRDLPERQRILKDSHVGSFAVICVGMLLLSAFALMLTADLTGSRALLLLFLPLASRCPSALAVMSLEPMGTSGYAGDFRKGVTLNHKAAVGIMLLVALILPPILWGLGGLCTAAAAVGAVLCILHGRKQLGGMSGDISGLAVTVGEFCGLLVLALS
jgi:adenosylcobinamide-GDP ribazoletransferase